MRPPKTAYVLLWFPKPSETFVFRETVNLWRMGLDLHVYTLYGALEQGLSHEMRSVSDRVERLGLPYLPIAHRDIHYWRRRNRQRVREIMRDPAVWRWAGAEKTGEKLWAALAGFRLARRFDEEGIEHIHAPWAHGPATAAWIASRLTGIPFSFTARAWDIYPPDGALKEKLRDATLVRSETFHNIPYIGGFLNGDTSKIHLTYNGIPLKEGREAPVTMQPPYSLLAIGRFVGKKGFDYLIRACAMLHREGMDFRLTLAGDGPREGQFRRLVSEAGLENKVSFPGFVPYDSVPELFLAADMLVMPSVVHSSGDRDGIPTVIMEALMHRVPVIATDVSGISEVVEDGETGLLIPEKNAVAIAEAVKRMTSDRVAAISMAERGRTKVLEQFDPEKNHRHVLSLYTRHIPTDPTD